MKIRLIVKITTALYPHILCHNKVNLLAMCTTGKVLVFSTDMIFSIVSYTMHATD